MRIYDNRYNRERLRFHVALRFIRLEARTRTIRLWTGLTDDRIRKLYRSYLADSREPALPRHRGKSPQRVAVFLRSARTRHETALLASLYRLLGALPDRPSSPAVAPRLASSLPSLGRAELLCQAYEVYRGLVPEPMLAFEHAVFLVTTLARGDELTFGTCRDCHAVVVVDRWSLRPARCTLCAAEADSPVAVTAAVPQALAAGADGLQDCQPDAHRTDAVSPE